LKTKRYALFFLIIFSIFLVSPAVVRVIEANVDVSYFFNIAEEENKHSQKEYKDVFIGITNKPYDTNALLMRKFSLFFYKNNKYPPIDLDENCPPPKYFA